MSAAGPKPDPSEGTTRLLANESDRLRLLLDSSNALISHRNLRDLFLQISKSLRGLFHHEMTALTLYDEKLDKLRLYAMDFPTSKGIIQESLLIPMEGSPAGTCFRARK